MSNENNLFGHVIIDFYETKCEPPLREEYNGSFFSRISKDQPTLVRYMKMAIEKTSPGGSFDMILNGKYYGPYTYDELQKLKKPT